MGRQVTSVCYDYRYFALDILVVFYIIIIVFIFILIVILNICDVVDIVIFTFMFLLGLVYGAVLLVVT